MPAPLIAGNWKMHKTVSQTVEFIDQLVPHLSALNCRVWIAPPFTSIYPASLSAKGTPLAIGAQNLSEHESGAFTGEVSASMLKEAGASFTLIGHSERRSFFKESNDQINKKLVLSLKHGLTPILCIGETLAERERGAAKQQLHLQIAEALKGIEFSRQHHLVVAYEPVWAIGTGQTATPEMAGEAHGWIQHSLEKIVSKEFANRVTLIYGGSVKPSNIADLLSQKQIHGVLVGGASLELATFIELINEGKKI